MHYYYLKVILSSDFPCSTLELMYYFHHIMSRVHVFASFITVDFYYLSTVDSVGFSIVKWPSIPPPFPSVAFWGKRLSSVQSLSRVWLWPHESQHARPPCPSPTPGVHSDSHPSSQWWQAISSSVVPFSSYPKSLPASKYFPMSQLFSWGGQSTGVSALPSFLPKKSQGWSPSE